MSAVIINLIESGQLKRVPGEAFPGKHEDGEMYEGKPMRFRDHEGNVFWIPLHSWYEVAPQPAPYVPPSLFSRFWLAVHPWLLGAIVIPVVAVGGILILFFLLLLVT